MVTTNNETVWIANSTPYKTNFNSDKGKFKLEPEGVVGSVLEISREISKDPYVTRAIQRNKFRIVSEEEADALMVDLTYGDEIGHQHDELMSYLGVQNKEMTDLFKRDDLEDEAEALHRGWRADEILEGHINTTDSRGNPRVANTVPDHSHFENIQRNTYQDDDDGEEDSYIRPTPKPKTPTKPKTPVKPKRVTRAKGPFIEPVIDGSVLEEKITDYSDDISYLNSGF